MLWSSPTQPRRTKQIRNESSRDQRAVKANFAACQSHPDLGSEAGDEGFTIIVIYERHKDAGILVVRPVSAYEVEE